MVQKEKNELLLSLTNLLTGNRVESETLNKALKQICKTSSFQGGLVYEKELSDEFSLFGCYSSSELIYPKPTDLKDLMEHNANDMKKHPFIYISRDMDTQIDKVRFLNLYKADSIIFSPIFEDEGTLYGIVLLISTSKSTRFNESQLSTLSIACSMLVRYMEMRMYQRRLLQAQTTMESILDNTGIDIYVNDFYTHEILYVNKSMAEPYGGRSQFMGQTCWKILFPGQKGPCEFCPQNKLISEDGLFTKVYTWDYQRAFDGSWFRVFSSAFKWVDGRLAHVVSSADITDNKRNEALVENLANYDQLTKLPNRRMLMKECEKRIENASDGEEGYVLFFDIDRFKPINDIYGHDAGDDFLIQLGEFFSSIPLLKDSIFRNGGDEFVAIISGGNVSKGNIRSLANLILERFKKPWKLKKGDIFCSTSIGVSCFPEDSTSVDLLLQKADMAMYKVKKEGGRNLCFSYELEK